MIKRCVRGTNMQSVNDLIIFTYFLGFRDAMKSMSMQFMVLEDKMKSLITKCTLKLPTMHLKCVVGKTRVQLVK